MIRQRKGYQPLEGNGRVYVWQTAGRRFTIVIGRAHVGKRKGWIFTIVIRRVPFSQQKERTLTVAKHRRHRTSPCPAKERGVNYMRATNESKFGKQQGFLTLPLDESISANERCTCIPLLNGRVHVQQAKGALTT